MFRALSWLACCLTHRSGWRCLSTHYRDFANYETWECRRCGDRWTRERPEPG